MRKSLIALVFLTGCGTNAYHVAAPNVKWTWEKEHRVKPTIEMAQYRAAVPVTESGENSKAVTMVTGFEGKVIQHINVSPDGERVIFEYGRTGDKKYVPQICSVDTRGGKDLAAVTDGDTGCFSPVYTPDGTEVLLCSQVNGLPKMWSISADGRKSNLRQITTNKFIEGSPEISKDGKKIVFCAIMPDTSEKVICIANRDGTELTYVRQGKSPCFSPDGKEVAFAAPADDTEAGEKSDQIWTMDTKGNGLKQITRLSGNCAGPHYSPDGRYITFACDALVNDEGGKEEANYNVYSIDRDGAQSAVALTNNPATDVSPVWSPDGRFIYFCSNRGLQWNIWRLNLSESAMKLYPPSDVAAAFDKGSVSLAWKTKNSVALGGFNVYSRVSGSKTAEKISAQPVKESPYTVKGLKTNTIYFFSVSCVGKDYASESDRSAELMVTTPKISAPEKLTASAKKEYVALSWTKIPEVAGYNVYYRPSFGANFWKLNETPVGPESYRIGDKYLKAGTSYVFCVTSIDKNGFEGDRSGTAQAKLPVIVEKVESKKDAPAPAANSSGGWGSGAADWGTVK